MIVGLVLTETWESTLSSTQSYPSATSFFLEESQVQILFELDERNVCIIDRPLHCYIKIQLWPSLGSLPKYQVNRNRLSPNLNSWRDFISIKIELSVLSSSLQGDSGGHLQTLDSGPIKKLDGPESRVCRRPPESPCIVSFLSIGRMQ